MDLHIHPDAADALNARADALLLQVTPAPPRGPLVPRRPEAYVSHRITEADIIGPVTVAHRDHTGQETARFFESAAGPVGLQGPAFVEAAGIATRLQGARELRDRVSVRTVLDLMFEWIERRHHGLEPETSQMSSYVLTKAGSLVAMQEIWVPVTSLQITADLTFGKMTLKTLTAQRFDDWRAEALEREERRAYSEAEWVAKVDEWSTRHRKRYQGYTAATICVEAELKRAVEIAYAEADDALAMLRLFDGANLDPRIISGCAALGTHAEETRHYLQVQHPRLVRVSVGAAGPSTARYILDEEALAVFGRDLMTVGNLLKADERTPFQNQLLDAIRIYSRSSLARDPADKLIYILVALESMLVRDSSESLQSNIAERIAFLISDQLPQRREIIQSVKAAYGLRSAFLHHGRRPEDDLAVLTRFMNIAFSCMLGFIHNTHLPTIDALHRAIDDARLS